MQGQIFIDIWQFFLVTLATTTAQRSEPSLDELSWDEIELSSFLPLLLAFLVLITFNRQKNNYVWKTLLRCHDDKTERVRIGYRRRRPQRRRRHMKDVIRRLSKIFSLEFSKHWLSECGQNLDKNDPGSIREWCKIVATAILNIWTVFRYLDIWSWSESDYLPFPGFWRVHQNRADRFFIRERLQSAAQTH